MATKVRKEQLADQAWATWNPTVEGITIGSGSVTAKYMQVGKTVHINIKFVFGSGSGITGQISFTPPVTAADSHNTMCCVIEDSGSADMPGIAILVAGKIYCYAVNVAGTYATQAVFSSTVPMTWTTNDVLFINGTYQAA